MSDIVINRVMFLIELGFQGPMKLMNGSMVEAFRNSRASQKRAALFLAGATDAAIRGSGEDQTTFSNRFTKIFRMFLADHIGLTNSEAEEIATELCPDAEQLLSLGQSMPEHMLDHLLKGDPDDWVIDGIGKEFRDVCTGGQALNDLMKKNNPAGAAMKLVLIGADNDDT